MKEKNESIQAKRTVMVLMILTHNDDDFYKPVSLKRI